MSSRLSKELRLAKLGAGGDERKGPLALIPCEGPVTRTWIIPFPQGEPGILGICTLSRTGTVTMWSPNGKSKRMELFSGVESAVTAELILGPQVTSDSLLIMQSRTEGILIFRFSLPPKDSPLPPAPIVLEQLIVALQDSPHPGFCTLQLNNDLLVFPSGQDRFGVVSVPGLKRSLFIEESMPRIGKEEIADGMIMFTKISSNGGGGDELVVYGTETGSVQVCTVIRVLHDVTATEQVIIIPWKFPFNLNSFRGRRFSSETQNQRGTLSDAAGGDDEDSDSDDEDEPITPLCCDILPLLGGILIGTNTKYVYKLWINPANKSLGFEYRKRFPNKGVSAMVLHSSAKVIATGGWDGGIRIMGIPGMTPLHYIPFHEQGIVSLEFFNPGGPGQEYNILCGTGNSEVSIWNPGEKLVQHV